jgi:hypothetical protein
VGLVQMVVLVGLLLTSGISVLAGTPSPVGLWKTVDDETGEVQYGRRRPPA